MVVPKSSKFIIKGVASGILAEDLSVSVKTQYKDMFSMLETEAKNEKIINMAGATLKSLTGGRAGFSTQFKQSSAQIWDTTQPVQLQPRLEFNRLYKNTPDGEFCELAPGETASGASMFSIVKKIISCSLPSETGVNGKIGNLTPPGPSPIEGLGIDKIVEAIKGGGSPAQEDMINVGDSNKGGSNPVHGIVDVFVGNMKFRRMVLKSVDPVFSKYFDSSGYPISCTLSLELQGIWMATSNDVQMW